MSNYFKHKMRGKNPATIAALIVLGIIAFTGLAILFGFVIMWLWNWLMPEIFDLPTVTYWQAVGLFLLAKIIFGGFGSSNSSKNSGKQSWDGNNKKKKEFSKWEHYDQFWKEKGDLAYTEYVESLNGGGPSIDITDETEES